jgi:predicted nucleic acid-binding protein
MYLLDTNVVSALRRPNDVDANVRTWAANVQLAELFLSTITVLEIERGILLIERRDPAQAAILRTWLEGHVLTDFAGRIFPVDVPVARRCAPLHVPDRQPERDAMIAATALVHGLTVITRNTADFTGTGVALLNPWDAPV